MRYTPTLLLLLFVFNFSNAQVPDGYYDPAANLTGSELSTALYNIIKGHTQYPYTSSSTDVWDILKDTDRDPENPDNVILFYTGWSVNAAMEYNNGSGWNREHVWAKSRGDFGTTMGAGTDVHHLRPSDISVNSARNNRWFDYCDVPYLDAGVETGCFTSTTSWVWQPREQVKGDVARMIFYMATRYRNENGDPGLFVIDSIPADNYTRDPLHSKLSALLEWHRDDPVDEFERNRNDVIYRYQNNRNPFIDHPEFVNLIWNSDASVVYDTIHVYDTTFVTITTEVFETKYVSVTDTLFIDAVLTGTDVPGNINTLKVYPNPARDHLFITTGDFGRMPGFHINIIDQLGISVFETVVDAEIYELNLSDWSGRGIYFLQLIDPMGDVVDTRKIILQ